MNIIKRACLHLHLQVPATVRRSVRPFSRALLPALFLLTSNSPALEIQPRIIGGYTSEKNSRSYMTALLQKSSQVELHAGGSVIDARTMRGTPVFPVSGELVDCGDGTQSCDTAAGNICLFSRGAVYFYEMVQLCREAGGLAAIVTNNESGNFSGTISPADEIPTISVSQEDGQYLRDFAAGGYVEISEEILGLSTPFCGAAYLGGKWVITAAHCVDDVSLDQTLVQIGAWKPSKETANQIGISRIIVHSEFDEATVKNDIALLELAEKPIGVQAVKLLSSDAMQASIDSQLETVAMGWGQQVAVTGDQRVTDHLVDELHEVELPLISNTQCNDALNDYAGNYGRNREDYLTSGMLCAGIPSGGFGTCFGDSGGPLVLEQHDGDKLVGLTSWGLGCAQPGVYDVFTRVSNYESFVRRYYPELGNEIILEPVENLESTETENSSVTEPAQIEIPAKEQSGETSEGNKDSMAVLQSSNDSPASGGGSWFWLSLLITAMTGCRRLLHR